MSETSTAVTRKESTVFDVIQRQQEEFKKVLPSHMGGEHGIRRFVRMAVTTVKRVPKLQSCDATSLMGCLMDCAQLGLEPDSVLGTAYILPYKDKATLIIGYKGLIQLAYRSKAVKGLQAEVVYAKDTFENVLGSEPKLTHVRCDDEDPGKLTHAYAVAELDGGAKIWRVLSARDIERVKKSSQSAGFPNSPWTQHPEEMWKKSAIKALAKMLPLSPEFADAISKDNDGEYIDVPSVTIQDNAPKVLDSLVG